MRDPKRCKECGGPNPPPNRKHGRLVRVFCGDPCRLKSIKRRHSGFFRQVPKGQA